MKQRLKSKKAKKRKDKKRRIAASKKSYPTFADYFRDMIFETNKEWYVHHPNHELWFRKQLEYLFSKSLSTQTIHLLEELYQITDAVVLRSVLARRIHLLRVDYLHSFREYSDRALILLTERKKLFDKWEGIYILGCFGGRSAFDYLCKRLTKEKNQLLIQTIKRAIFKIEKNIKAKTLERGF